MIATPRKQKIIALYNEQSGFCVYCFEPMTLTLGFNKTATVDHVHARSKGGKKKHFNEVAACFECNGKKGDKDITAWLKENARRMALRFV